MKMRDFIYHEPGTTEEACSLLSRHGTDARIIAGCLAIVAGVAMITLL